ncbi:MAG: energy-coupling factor transporter transmembrane protein EcfT [Clostridium sp.]|nr:energy-coupling factor transporter transmembrane protein EcfT [Clostridium sp.]
MERLNPFYKAVTILVCGLLMSFSYSVELSLAVFGLCLAALLFASRARAASIVKIMIPAVGAALRLFFGGVWITRGAAGPAAQGSLNFALAAASSRSLYNALQLGSRVLAFAGLGILFALTTDGEVFVASLIHQGKIPPKFAYGVLAAFHLLPEIRKEYDDARLACQVRGMKLSPLSLKPAFTALVNGIRWSESVAMAMESKGFSGDGDRTYYAVTQVRWYDRAFAATALAGMAAGMLLCRW